MKVLGVNFFFETL